ncbi:hypothetical protein BN424_2147 [Carnobacterium maltaromaticum LMA28]|uniref:Uncharacterized protein n=1 Tax=Carnobacterium maltaromaticum LMA28 TaxID=1234679 RepID=K8E4S2_CARML|nr:hypothetical protein [Carnobacterium maltaromaticum]CCO11587.2 hypothetical protein BN424_2147 [Carnobacterium maltaromaticum LMA28]
MNDINEMEIIKIRGQEGRDYIKEKGYSHLDISDDGALLLKYNSNTETEESIKIYPIEADVFIDETKANISKEAMIEKIEEYK